MSVHDYIQKKTLFENVTAERTQMIGVLHGATRAMAEAPSAFHFSNCAGGFPPEVAFNRAAPTFDAQQWPTAQQIQNVLVRWHSAREGVLNAWRALSQSEQKAMQPPE
jgi:hypothetical protein